MEIIVAVLVYLNILVSGMTYTPVDINVQVSQNRPAVDAVLADPQETQNAIVAFEQSNWWINPQTNIVEEWEEDPEDVIIIERP